ncbi:MAG: transketolase [Bryobacteraceae bacterium]
MPAVAIDERLLTLLEEKATLLRIDSIRATTAATSGHPTSCVSAAEIMSVLFFSVMSYDPANPRNPHSDKFVLSKGHAAPILYAAWAEAGAFPVEHLTTLRRIDSDLEGHPTPRLPFVDVATGSLGQGLSAGVGMAAGAKLDNSGHRIYVLLGDGESAEGSVWESAEIASAWRLGNLCATIDINRLGQSQPTLLQHDMETHRRRWESFGWQALIVDGHNIPELLEAYAKAGQTPDRPTVVLARTIKGKGMLDVEDKEGEHGKAMQPDFAAKIIAALQQHLANTGRSWTPHSPAPVVHAGHPLATRPVVLPPYTSPGKDVATRKAFGDALAALGKNDPRIVVLDGDVKNSTYTEEFLKVCPDRFFECFIAEQNMVGAAVGLAAHGKIPFASTFGCFFTRAYDFLRMASISGANIKIAGTHVGVSIGEDGPSQMALEDIAMLCAEPNFTVLYPSDAIAAWRATELAIEHQGPCYLRLARPATPIYYSQGETFAVGKCKVVRQSDRDRAVIVTGGVTLVEALKAYDQLRAEGLAVRVIDLFSIQPIDRVALIEASRAVGGLIITVEDHYVHGGLGDAVLAALAEERVSLHKLAVREIPHSGKSSELLDRYGISAGHIVETARTALTQESRAAR